MPDNKARRAVSNINLPAGSWRQAHKSQICGAEQINDKDSITVTTATGAVLSGNRGDYLVWDENKPAERWIVEQSVFRSTYQMTAPGKFQKTAFTDILPITEPVAVETKEGVVSGEPGDFIARGVQGEIWVIPADFFATSYKFVD